MIDEVRGVEDAAFFYVLPNLTHALGTLPRLIGSPRVKTRSTSISLDVILPDLTGEASVKS